MAAMIIRPDDRPVGVDRRKMAARKPIAYEEVEIRSRRIDAKTSEVWVQASPVGDRKWLTFPEQVVELQP